MEQQKEFYWNKNNAKLVGKIDKEFWLDHEVFGINFYMTKIAVPRKSGVVDHLPIMISEKLLKENGDLKEKNVCIYGQVRTFEILVQGYNGPERRKKMYVFVNKIRMCEHPEIDANNIITLDGYLGEKPLLRRTKKGIKIAEVSIAVERKNGSLDYIPCVGWNILAQRTSDLEIGRHIICQGRLETREYNIKNPEHDRIEKYTRYEVSIIKLHEK